MGNGMMNKYDSYINKILMESDIDSEYLSTVESGDMDTAQKMVDDAAQAGGYTIKAYHATDKNFNQFDIKRARRGRRGVGFYFSETTPYSVRGGIIISAYLKNPEISQEPQRIFKNSDKMTDREYVVRNPNQIKSVDPVTKDDQGQVIPLSKRFNPSTEDIRY